MLFLVWHLSSLIYNTSICGAKFSWTSLYHDRKHAAISCLGFSFCATFNQHNHHNLELSCRTFFRRPLSLSPHSRHPSSQCIRWFHALLIWSECLAPLLDDCEVRYPSPLRIQSWGSRRCPVRFGEEDLRYESRIEKASVLMQRLSYPIRSLGNRIVLSFKDSLRKPLGRQPKDELNVF